MIPRPVEAFPCGSTSINKVFLPVAAIAVAKFMAEVVFPTPPFWLANAIMLSLLLLSH
jgi:hypothetical protein